MSTPKVVKRAGWGARKPKYRNTSSAQKVDAIHHTTGKTLGHIDEAQWVRNIQAFHMGPSRGWSDIGYNWIVGPSGTIYEGRGDGVIGAHVAGRNASLRGIAYLGDGSDEVPAAALRSIAWLVGGRPAKCHGDLAATSCPGRELGAWVRGGMKLTSPSKPSKPGKVKPRPKKRAYPSWDGTYYRLRKFPRKKMRGKSVLEWQRQMRRRGWTITADGIFGKESHRVLVAFQKEKRAAGYKIDGRKLSADGVLGPLAYRAAFDAPVTR